MDVTIRPLRADERAWANQVYADIGFAPSPDEDLLLVAERGAERVGLGRLVPLEGAAVELGGIWTAPTARQGGVARAIVASLLARAGSAPVWCIPYTHLAAFYGSFALVPAPPPWPAAVAAKVAALRARDIAVEVLRR